VTEYVRIRHYTNRSRSQLIAIEQAIRMGAHGAVFCEIASLRPLAPIDAEERYRLKRGRARDYIEVDVPRSWVVRRVNRTTGAEEWLVRRDVPLDASATIVRRQ